MIDRFSPPVVGAFELVFRPWMRTRVHAVRMTGLPAALPPHRPLLLVANHVSWWDGFVLREVQRALRPDAPFHVVMTTRELTRFPFFRQMGAIGIDRESAPSIARAVRALQARLRTRPDAVIAYFPQGRIWTSQRRPLGFLRGVELFARRLDPLVLPVGLHVEPLNHISPTHFAAVGPTADGGDGASVLEAKVEAQLDAITALLTQHGEDADRHWPGLHGRLVGAAQPVAETT